MSAHKRIIVHALIVLSVLVTIGVSQFRSYGISYDEPVVRSHGIQAAKFVADTLAPTLSETLSTNPIYKSIPDATQQQGWGVHQVFFELALIFMEYQFGLTYDKKRLYEFRHLATFLFCSVGLLIFFVFLYWRFRSLRLSYLGVLLIVLSPRIFADMFYNNKDAVFMTTYLIAGVISVIYIVRRSSFFLILSAIAIGLSVSGRVVGIIPAVLVYISILFYFRNTTILDKMVKILLHSTLTLASTILFHPYYWSDPIRKLIETFVATARYPYTFSTLTLGQSLESTSLPWFYIPLWVSVTIPLLFLATFLLGMLRVQIDFFLNIGNRQSTKIDFFVLALVVSPILIAVIARTSLYNGWRHFYFIYPFLSYFGVRFFSKSPSNFLRKSQLVLSSLVIFTFISTASWMFTNRPLQNLYFNQLAGKEISTNWELDYFCLSNRHALEWIVSRDSRESISIQTNDNSPLYDSVIFLSREDRDRLDFLWYDKGIGNADYVIARQDLNSESRELRKILNSRESGFRLVYKKSIGQTEIFSIYAKVS